MNQSVATDGQRRPAPRRVMRTPRRVTVEVTAKCNLRCRYCYFFDNAAVPYRDLPVADWQRFFEECGRSAVMGVTIAGGEPFLRHDLPRIIEAIVANGMRFSVLSNGSLIDDEAAAFLAATGRCDSVQISVDGPRPESHDVCRGKGAFEGAIRGIRILMRHGVNVTARVTIHRHNVGHLEATARLLLDDLGLKGIGTNAAGYLGSCRRNAGAILLSVADRQAAMETLLALTVRYPGRISASAGPLAEARRWGAMEEARAAGRPAIAGGGSLSGCGCSWSSLAVRSDGAIVPCSMLNHVVLGQIGVTPLAEVWRESSDLNRLRRRGEIELTEFAMCRGCSYVPYCTGNCPALAYSMTGRLDNPSPEGCLRHFVAGGGTLS